MPGVSLRSEGRERFCLSTYKHFAAPRLFPPTGLRRGCAHQLNPGSHPGATLESAQLFLSRVLRDTYNASRFALSAPGPPLPRALFSSFRLAVASKVVLEMAVVEVSQPFLPRLI